MTDIGRFNTLQVRKLSDIGAFLDGEEMGDILLPKSVTPEGCEPGKWLDVFIYLDSEDRLIATTMTPKIQVGEVAYLKVVDTNNVGAFLDWGLPKDLLVPFFEQHTRLEQGKSYLVYAYLDSQTNRIVASSKLNKFIKRTAVGMQEAGQEVDLIIADKTDLGYMAIIDSQNYGLIHFNDMLQPLRRGSKVKGYIKQIRSDGKIDLSLQKIGSQRIDSLQQRILDALSSQNGFLPLHDKSAPDEIFNQFQVSKKAYKMAIGGLMKQGKVRIEADGIHLI